ncbi:MAG TPA: ankyrin repeat domain-containing protein [Thermoanaerobaculia bacterium]
MKKALLLAVCVLIATPLFADDAKALFERIRAHDAKGVEALLKSGVKPSVRDDSGRTPLWNAIEQKDLDTINVLLAANADPNDPGKHVNEMYESGATLAMQAVDSGNVAILNALLAKGAKPDVANQYGMNALMIACMAGNASMVSALIEGKANVNATDSGGTPVLWMAVKGGSADAVAAMLKAGAKFGEYKQLVIDTANEGGDAKIIALITEAAEAN